MAQIRHTGGEQTSALGGKLSFEQDMDRILGRDQNNLARLVILADGNQFAMKVSKPNVDVLTATDDQLIFNSAQDVFKVVKSGTATTGTYTVVGTSGQWNTSLGSPLTIPHNLGYIPAVVAYIQQPQSGAPDQYVFIPTTLMSTASSTAAIFNRIGVNVDSTNLYILDTTITNGAVSSRSAGGLKVKYFLLQESTT